MPLCSFSVEKPWPPKKTAAPVFPLFLPFAGCGGRCIFCSQEAQTGRDAISGHDSLINELEKCGKSLAIRQNAGKAPPQLAFYGGTFTALDQDQWEICLDFARACMQSGLISSFRCSTRPDRIEISRLNELADSGCRIVELGIQSFSNPVLALARRGYDSRACLNACRMAAGAGLVVCVHLMPGLPGAGPDIFLEDVEIALAAGAKAMRFSPCLVLKGTKLAKMWETGQFSPWNIDMTLETLAEGYLNATACGATVIRMGLSPEERLEKSMLAGPAHSCLGSRVIARATLKTVLNALNDLPPQVASLPRKLFVPEWRRGDFWGWRNELRMPWKKAGICPGNVFFWDKAALKLELGVDGSGECAFGT